MFNFSNEIESKNLEQLDKISLMYNPGQNAVTPSRVSSSRKVKESVIKSENTESNRKSSRKKQFVDYEEVEGYTIKKLPGSNTKIPIDLDNEDITISIPDISFSKKPNQHTENNNNKAKYDSPGKSELQTPVKASKRLLKNSEKDSSKRIPSKTLSPTLQQIQKTPPVPNTDRQTRSQKSTPAHIQSPSVIKALSTNPSSSQKISHSPAQIHKVENAIFRLISLETRGISNRNSST